MFRTLTKKRSIVALSIVAVLALAGGAYAYFTATGSGTGTATVGSSTPFSVATSAASGTLYPGGPGVTIPFTVTNNGSGAQNVATIAATVTSGGSNSSCLASWFTATPNNTSPAADLAPNAQYSGSVTVKLTDTGSNQDACQGQTPTITVNAS